MNAHTLTPIAATAIIAQIDGNADCGGDKFYAEVNGQEWEFSARFAVAWSREDRYSDTHSNGFGYDDWAECVLIGAWSYDDNGDVQFAGNRAEAAALVGLANVREWEAQQSEKESGI